MFDFFTIFRTIVFIFVSLMWVKMFIFLVLSPFYPIKEHMRRYRALQKRKTEGHGEYKPKVSIIVPAWNEEVGILRTVKSVLANDYENIEIVVVNDGSTDNSDKVIKEFVAQVESKKWVPKNLIKYKYQKNGGKGVALNTGIEMATGDIILTMDADSVIDTHGISNLVEYYLDDKVMAAVGNVKVAGNSTLVGLTQQLEYFFGFYFKRAHGVMGAEYIFGGACASFRREVFEKLGLFDTKNKTEDIEMSMRVRAAGMECAYMENVVAYTEGASTVISLINQRLRWKKGRFDTFKQFIILK